MRRILVSILVLLASTRLCFAGEPVTPGNPAPAIDAMLQKSPETTGVFSARPDGSALHIQSGFVCPASFPNVNLWQVQVFSAAKGQGTDVGCDYGRVRSGTTNQVEAKFTIFIVKAQQGMTLDEVFAGYLREMRTTLPPQKMLGKALELTDNSTSKLPEIRSQTDQLTLGGRTYNNEIIVGVANGWAIELRATYPIDFAPGDPATGIDLPASAVIWVTTVGRFIKGDK